MRMPAGLEALPGLQIVHSLQPALPIVVSQFGRRVQEIRAMYCVDMKVTSAVWNGPPMERCSPLVMMLVEM